MAIPKTELSTSGQQARDQKAKAIGLLVGIPGQLYFTSISRVSDVYIDYIDGQFVSWRQRYYTKNSNDGGVKVIATGSFNHVIERTKKYLSYIKRR